MFYWRLFSLFILCVFSFNLAAQIGNPFDKKEVINIGREIAWEIDSRAVVASKTVSDADSTYYHLRYDNKQLELMVSTDINGLVPKQFSHLEITDVKIDGRRSELFAWCLNNQQSNQDTLQQDLLVRKNICMNNGGFGSFVMRLNGDTVASLRNGRTLSLTIKPYRTPLELIYDITDFDKMYVALNPEPEPAPVAKSKAKPGKQADTVARKECMLDPPVKFRTLKPVSYICADKVSKSKAEKKLEKTIASEKARQQKLAAEQEKQRKLKEQQKQKELAAKLKLEQLKREEAAAIAASKVRQAEINEHITQKMLGVCEKFWNNGEHRCYCQKFIEYAPPDIQKNSSCQ